MTTEMKTRINKFIAQNSKFSRRVADELIASGKVYLNGKKVTDLGLSVDPELDEIKIDGKLITQKNDFIYLALNKPKGFVTTRKDELKRATVMNLVPKIANLKPAGRLDMETEGLLILSNNGDFINKLTHPRFECEKKYFAKVKGELLKEEKEKLEKGVFLDGKKTSRARIEIINATQSETRLVIKIHEGRNRQIRRMFEIVKHGVKYLKRISIDQIELGDLTKGKYRNLTTKEIDAFKPF